LSESAASQTERGRRKSLVGIVVSNKMDKTAVVAVERRERHPLYRKIVRSTKRYKAHDPNNAAVLGDVVRIEESRPLSREKRWRIAETFTRGNVADVAPREIGVPEELDQPIEPVEAAAPPAIEETAPAVAAVAGEAEAVAEAASDEPEPETTESEPGTTRAEPER
jgi:small subunit ribosomal protein S17